MHWLAAFLLLVELAFHGSFPATFHSAPGKTATQAAAFSGAKAEYIFGSQITFAVQVTSTTPLRGVNVYIQPQGESTVWEAMTVDDQGQAMAEIDVRRLPLLPFSTVTYRFEAIFNEGPSKFSQDFFFQYDDQRFDWQSLENESFQVSWYNADGTLGQDILNIARRGLQESQTLIDARLPGRLRIYAYASYADLQSALGLAGQSWVAGHASPETNMILISVPSGPEKKLELERQVPHEIMHILQYQVMGSSFPQQPAWLVEGMASVAELYPDPEYQRVLEATAGTQTLLPMNSLCAPFPRDAATFFRAYAQSESFVRFIYGKYGKPGLLGLIEQYSNGLGCEAGVSAALGASLSQLEYRWKQESLGIGAGRLLLRNLAPYLLIGIVVILLPALIAFLPWRKRREA